MGVVTNPPGLPLWSDYTRFARRYALLVAALMAIGAAAGVGWALQQSRTYSATASLALTPVPKYITPSTTELVAPEVTIDTDAQLLQSPKVMDAVGAALGTDPVAAAGHLGVSASPNTGVLHITIRASSGERAAAAANAAVLAFVDVRRDTLGSLRQDQLSQLELLVANQERELSKEQSTQVIIPATDDLFAQLQQLRADIAELAEARRHPVQSLGPATPPNHADYANSEVPVVSGAMLGLLAACVIGAVRDWARVESSALTRHLPQLSGPLSAATTLREDVHHAV